MLTGYWDPPAGCEEREGLHYNPYFAGGYIAMAKALYNEVVDYEDGMFVFTSLCVHVILCVIRIRGDTNEST